MQQQVSQDVNHSSIIVPLAVFLISLIGPAVVLALPSMLGWRQDYLPSHLYIFGTLGQALMDLPALVMLVWNKSARSDQKQNRVLSIAIGLVCAAIFAGIRLAISSRLAFMGGVPAFTQSLTLDWPWSPIAAALAVLAYGPGEALYIGYFVIAFDAAAESQHRLISRGVVITALLWGLSHIWNVFFFGWGALGNALFMVFIGLAIGVLFKGTRSLLGPVIFWSLANGTSI